MSKDPAVLWYTSDFLTGTMFMSNEQLGIYTRLLCAQHQHGGIIDKVSFNMSVKKEDELLRSKFIECDNGFYNKRMKEEMEARNNWVESRRKNGGKSKKSICKAYAKHIEDEDEDVNRNRNKKFIIPKEEEVIKYFMEKGYKPEAAKKAFLYYSEMDWHDSKGNAIKSWKGKMVAVWFKEENKKLTLKEMSDERKFNR